MNMVKRKNIVKATDVLFILNDLLYVYMFIFIIVFVDLNVLSAHIFIIYKNDSLFWGHNVGPYAFMIIKIFKNIP